MLIIVLQDKINKANRKLLAGENVHTSDKRTSKEPNKQ